MTNSHQSFLAIQLTGSAALLLILAFSILTPNSLKAQPFYFGNENPRETTAVSASFSLIDFSFNGNQTPTDLLEFSEPAYGLTFSRSNLFASFMWGVQNNFDSTQADLGLVDFSLFIWTDVFFSQEAQTADNRFFVPISLFSNYRRVSPRPGSGAFDEFNIATLGLGLGVGYFGKLSESFILELRSIPALGYSAQSFGDSSGISRLIDTDLQIHIDSVFNSIGLSFGYTFRIQDWDIRGGSLFGSVSNDLYDYKSVSHSFSIGANF